MILDLIDLVLTIRSADRAMREKSRVGESGMDREAGRFTSKLWFVAIAIIVLAPVAWLVIEVAF